MVNSLNMKDENSKENNKENSIEYNKIITGDSLYVLKKYPDNIIDLIFTSPPYNFGIKYDKYKDDVDWKDYFSFLYSIFDECIRVLKHGGRLLVNIRPNYCNGIPTHHILSNYFLNKGLLWKGEIIWEKNHYGCSHTAWGSWKSPSNPYLKTSWEFILVYCKGSLCHSGDKNLIDITSEEFKSWTYARWNIPPETKMNEYGHPAMFPEKLVERAIKLFSFKGDIVLDPFNGVGTTCVVAHKLGRKYIGIDISEEYCRIAEKRIKNSCILDPLFIT